MIGKIVQNQKKTQIMIDQNPEPPKPLIYVHLGGLGGPVVRTDGLWYVYKRPDFMM